MTDIETVPAADIDATARMARALELGVPRVYVNGFVNGIGLSDIWCVLERNGQPEAIVNLSYTAAKSLAASLGQLIAILEEKTGRDMLTTRDIEKLFMSREDPS